MAQIRLKEILTSNGIRQSTLASITGLAVGYINKICNKKVIPSLTTKNIILKGLTKLSSKSFSLEEVFGK